MQLQYKLSITGLYGNLEVTRKDWDQYKLKYKLRGDRRSTTRLFRVAGVQNEFRAFLGLVRAWKEGKAPAKPSQRIPPKPRNRFDVVRQDNVPEWRGRPEEGYCDLALVAAIIESGDMGRVVDVPMLRSAREAAAGAPAAAAEAAEQVRRCRCRTVHRLRCWRIAVLTLRLLLPCSPPPCCLLRGLPVECLCAFNTYPWQSAAACAPRMCEGLSARGEAAGGRFVLLCRAAGECVCVGAVRELWRVLVKNSGVHACPVAGASPHASPHELPLPSHPLHRGYCGVDLRSVVCRAVRNCALTGVDPRGACLYSQTTATLVLGRACPVIFAVVLHTLTHRGYGVGVTPQKIKCKNGRISRCCSCMMRPF